MRLLLIILISIPLQAADIRYCGSPLRDESGRIKRSTFVINEFKRVHPCPSTGLQSGSCPGWAIDHVIPLACGGCDAIENMQWLPYSIKRGHELAKDKWERKIYKSFEDIADTEACNRVIIPGG